jgi:gas vesicle protein
LKIKSLLLGILVGGAAAGITTLLTTPASGKETRQYLKENKDLWLNQLSVLKRNLAELKDAAVFASKEGKEGISIFVSDVKSAISDWKKEIRPHQQELQNQIQEIEKTLYDLEKTIKTQQ